MINNVYAPSPPILQFYIQLKQNRSLSRDECIMQDEAGVSWLVAACFLTVVKVHASQAMNLVTCITAIGSKEQGRVIHLRLFCIGYYY